MPSSSSMPALRRRPARASSGARSAERVLALDAVARVEDAVGPAAVVGQHEQALGVLVEPADRIQPGAVGDERGRDEVEDGRVGMPVARRRGDARRLVEEQMGRARRPRRSSGRRPR